MLTPQSHFQMEGMAGSPFSSEPGAFSDCRLERAVIYGDPFICRDLSMLYILLPIVMRIFVFLSTTCGI